VRSVSENELTRQLDASTSYKALSQSYWYSTGPIEALGRSYRRTRPAASPVLTGQLDTLSQRCLLHTESSYWVWNATARLKALQRGGNESPTIHILGN
jgi:hypothetical protein